jgi:hypothetical protein
MHDSYQIVDKSVVKVNKDLSRIQYDFYESI